MQTWKKVLLFVIVPALITGLLSLAPKIIDLINEPTASLSYSINEGPGLEVDGKWRKVVSVDVINSGKLSLNNIYAEFTVNNGIVENSAIYDYLGLKPEINKSTNSSIIKIHKLHSNEKIRFSSMLLLSDPETKMNINIRSDELRGVEAAQEIKGQDTVKELTSALLAGLSVIVMSSFALLMFRRGRLRSLPFFPHKQDVLLYILFRAGYLDICKKMIHSDNEYTYLRVADIFLVEGILNSEARSKAINGLKSLLLIKSMAKTSQEVVIDNLKRLEGDKYSSDEIQELVDKSKSVEKLIEVRKLIDEAIY